MPDVFAGTAYHERLEALGLGASDTEDACGWSLLMLAVLPLPLFPPLRSAAWRLAEMAAAIASTGALRLLAPLHQAVGQARTRWEADLQANLGPVLAMPAFALGHLLVLLPALGAAWQLVHRLLLAVSTAGIRLVYAIEPCVEPRSIRLMLGAFYALALLSAALLRARALTPAPGQGPADGRAGSVGENPEPAFEDSGMLHCRIVLQAYVGMRSG